MDPTTRELRGVIVCKLEYHRSGTYRGYIAMLAVDPARRGRGIATRLVQSAVDSMKAKGADEVRVSTCGKTWLTSQVVLETEVTNAASLRLYQRVGFLRTKRLHRYYLNGNTAFRLALYLKEGIAHKESRDPHWDGYD